MNESGTGGVGSAPVQALQLSTLAACLSIGKWRRFSLRECVDVWIVGTLYFGCVALYLAAFFAEDERFVEITYAARFIMWFLFAAVVTRGSFGFRQLERLATSFLIGTFIQGVLAIWAFKTQSVGSIYKEVYATTGGAYVSGKTIVSFMILGIFLASYWLITNRRFRGLYSLSIIIGFLVVLFSYNRATQLSLAIVVLFVGFWLFRKKKIKILFLLAIVGVFIVGFLTSSMGDSFLLRWQNIQEDGGSGRVTLVCAAVKNFIDPDSMTSLLLGKGYHQTKLLMYQACGAYIGTHSDLFDFLTVYGFIGGAFYFWIALKILTMDRDLPSYSLEYLCIRSSGVFIVLTGLCTGLFQSTYTFFMFFTLCQYWYERGKGRFCLRVEPFAVGVGDFSPLADEWKGGGRLLKTLKKKGAEYVPNDGKEAWNYEGEELAEEVCSPSKLDSGASFVEAPEDSFVDELEQNISKSGASTLEKLSLYEKDLERNESSEIARDVVVPSEERIKRLDEFFRRLGEQESFFR